jgi:hypothetical protein
MPSGRVTVEGTMPCYPEAVDDPFISPRGQRFFRWHGRLLAGSNALALTARTTENCGRCGTPNALQNKAANPTYCSATVAADRGLMLRYDVRDGPVEIELRSKIYRASG